MLGDDYELAKELKKRAFDQRIFPEKAHLTQQAPSAQTSFPSSSPLEDIQTTLDIMNSQSKLILETLNSCLRLIRSPNSPPDKHPLTPISGTPPPPILQQLEELQNTLNLIQLTSDSL